MGLLNLPGSGGSKDMPGLKGRLYTFIQSALTLLLLTYFFSVDRACTLLTFTMISTIASLQFGSHEACAWTSRSYGHLLAVLLLQFLPGRVPSSIACLASAALCASAYLGLVRIWLPSAPIRLDGWVVVVTGSSAGIGLETARHLLRLGATVVFACRTEARARAAMADALATTGAPSVKAVFAALDMADCASVRAFVDTFKKVTGLDRVDALVCNAGGMHPQRKVSAHGWEMNFGVHQLGHFLLAQLLLPRLRTAAAEGGGRGVVVSVASSLHKIAPEARCAELLDDPMSEKG